MTNEMNNMMENELENVSGGAYETQYYVIKAGDTLGAIAAKYGTTVNNLMALNPYIKNANLIYPGNKVRLY